MEGSILESFVEIIKTTGFYALTPGHLIMIAVACLLIYLAIVKGYEPLLLVPIGFGMILANLPLANMMAEPQIILGADGLPEVAEIGGLLYYLFQGDHLGIFPPLIFLGIGAMTDFSPLIANPKSLLLGAAAQLGIFITFLGALVLGYTPAEAGAIGIIGGADGPTSIFLASRLATHLLGPIAVAAYSYMALVPIIQPPIIRLLTTAEERKIKMNTLKPVSKRTKILFPIATTILVCFVLPSAAPLIGMLMLGNLFKECGVTDRLSDTAQNSLINIVTIFLGITVGATATAETFLNIKTIGIFVLGLAAFSFSTAGGVLLAKVMRVFSKTPLNPMIGAAGVSAVPMSARVVHKMGQKENPRNYLLMHAMGPNVAGVIGSAVAAGVLLSLLK